MNNETTLSTGTGQDISTDPVNVSTTVVTDPKEGSVPPVDKDGNGTVLTSGNDVKDASTEDALETSETSAEEFTLSIPEGDASFGKVTDAIAAFAKKHAVDKESAQGLLNDLFQASNARNQEFVDTIKSDWLKSIQEHPEYGGANFELNQKRAQRAYQQFATEGLTELLNKSGLGNNPHIFEMFLKIDKLVSSDTASFGNRSSTKKPGLDGFIETSLKKAGFA